MAQRRDLGCEEGFSASELVRGRSDWLLLDGYDDEDASRGAEGRGDSSVCITTNGGRGTGEVHVI